MKTTATAVLDVPISRAWEVLADHEGMSSWGPVTVTLDRPGTPERSGLGAVRRIVAPGPAPAIVEEVVVFEPQRQLSYRAVSGVPFRNYRCDVMLTEVPQGTQVDYSVGYTPRVLLLERVPVALVARGLLAAYSRAVRRAD